MELSYIITVLWEVCIFTVVNLVIYDSNECFLPDGYFHKLPNCSSQNWNNVTQMLWLMLRHTSFLSISLPDLQLDLNQSVFLCDKYLFTLRTTLNYDGDILNLAWKIDTDARWIRWINGCIVCTETRQLYTYQKWMV